ncbi:hypothetical protein GCM10022247_61230 [Allokutzneria multivorans]|uniref:Nucleotidyltransferase AbiEii toxin of type IV toxin-antitoxin system n=1 Tax=Allokutzneria multivorans TaxID=1142134 RepID=A0ABP7TLK0_9PSEU
MLEQDELLATAHAYGVSEGQVRRDHLISHALAALARTYLDDPDHGARLSEDIDLCAINRREVATVIDERLPNLLRREFPRTTWDPPLRDVRAVEPGLLRTEDGTRVRVQLLDGKAHHDFTKWPTVVRVVGTRYRDIAAPISLRVPTLASAAAMKTVAWMDRHAARDLYDLNGLAALGALNAETAELVREVTGWQVAPYMFRSLPSLDWHDQLGHQTKDLPTPESCLDRVRRAYGDALGWALS